MSLHGTYLNAQQGSRPLFFVTHSLGGLVVEDMLLGAKNSAEEHHRLVLESTRGICFMGTPHCGSQIADWAKVCTSVVKLVKRLNESLITVLQPESEVLARVQQDFHTMLRARNDAGKHKIRITCFFEDLDTPGVGAVVPKHSAILPAYSPFSVPAGHSGMTKFSDAQAVGYERVSNELWIWNRDLRVIVPSVSATPVFGQSTNSQEQPQLLLAQREHQPAGNFYQGSMTNVDQVFQGSTIGTFHFSRP
ncbi:uncharacterized protein LTR77_011180 [Saxophila tyrrhenica]|uniref:DUF676 domain-containing protein n=1 Tax=Saxophila tyrrhenica TaxID=1690608 RepID=A0AAV9NWP3_9PEZI|nr:hypothetical protein LTR77_011180 [Saxophila tyrrhenica]